MRIHHCNERHISLILCILPRGSCLLLDIVNDWHHGISIRCLLMSLVMQIYLVNIKPLCRLVIQVVAEDDHHHALASGGYSKLDVSSLLVETSQLTILIYDAPLRESQRSSLRHGI